jgi:hypothetical protein
MKQEPDLKKAKPVQFISKPSTKTIDGKSLNYSWPKMKMDTTGIKKVSPKDLENIKKGNYKKGGSVKSKKKK